MQRELSEVKAMVGLSKLTSTMVEALVERPEDVLVTAEKVGERSMFVRVSVGVADRGRVIGKDGRTARLLRSIVSLAANQANMKCEFYLERDGAVTVRQGLGTRD